MILVSAPSWITETPGNEDPRANKGGAAHNLTALQGKGVRVLGQEPVHGCLLILGQRDDRTSFASGTLFELAFVREFDYHNPLGSGTPVHGDGASQPISRVGARGDRFENAPQHGGAAAQLQE
jgi:hypothetical protein